MPKQIDVYPDGDWGSDEEDRKSVSGGAIIVGSCRMHAHCRGQAEVALSSGQSEIASATESIREAMLLQFNLEFAGFGNLPIKVHIDASVARAFIHRIGVGKQKHIDIKFCWLQDAAARNKFQTHKIPREENPGDCLTHPPTAKDLQKFCPMLGLYRLDFIKQPYQHVTAKLMAARNSHGSLTAKGVAMAALMIGALENLGMTVKAEGEVLVLNPAGISTEILGEALMEPVVESSTLVILFQFICWLFTFVGFVNTIQFVRNLWMGEDPTPVVTCPYCMPTRAQLIDKIREVELFVTPTGSKIHAKDCVHTRHLRQLKIYKLCSVCVPQKLSNLGVDADTSDDDQGDGASTREQINDDHDWIVSIRNLKRVVKVVGAIVCTYLDQC